MISLSRNNPVAFVVGVAGFLGSHLSECLLQKGIQVVGVDNLSSGNKDNLMEASKNKNFHFINQDFSLAKETALPKIDYAFFLVSPNIRKNEYENCIDNFIKLIDDYRCKAIAVSSVNLYDEKDTQFPLFRLLEKRLSKFAVENSANVRVVRLSRVFGPRMRLSSDDAISRLIADSITKNLNQDVAALDFTTRDLYIDDAIELLVKAVFHGATAQKIYDGVLPNPIKISEIKQILIDPLWHEARNFTPTPLPPWPTPNLSLTQKELNWRPKTQIVKALKETFNYFNQNQELLKSLSQTEPVEEVKTDEASVPTEKLTPNILRPNKERVSHGFFELKKDIKRGTRSFGRWLIILTGIFLIGYGLVYPSFLLSYSVFDSQKQRLELYRSVEAGNFDQAMKQVQILDQNRQTVNDIKRVVDITSGIGLFKSEFEGLSALFKGIGEILLSQKSYVYGSKALYDSVRIINGEVAETEEMNLSKALENSRVEYVQAGNLASLASADLQSFNSLLPPSFIKDRVSSEIKRIEEYRENISTAGSWITLLPLLVKPSGSASYLVLLQDNSKLRAGGGVNMAYGKVSFSQGKVQKIETDLIDKLSLPSEDKVSAPPELSRDFAVSELSPRDLNTEVDYPTNARLIQWFYQKQFNDSLDGVITLDLSMVEKLLVSTGGLSTTSPRASLSGDNLFAQLKDIDGNKPYDQLLQEVLNRIFFLPYSGLGEMSRVLNQSILEKHILIYFNNPDLLSYINSSGWAATMPRVAVEQKGQRKDLVVLTDTNISSLTSDERLKRSIEIETKLDSDMYVNYILKASFNNSDPNNRPSKRRIKLYLPTGTKLQTVYWGEKDLKPDTASFVDYGYAGYSMLIDLLPGETRKLIVTYQDSDALELVNGKADLLINLIKQPGTISDSVTLSLTLPEGYRIATNDGGDKAVSSSITRDFNTNLSFMFQIQTDK